MKQILQDMSNGNTSIIEAPSPSVAKGSLLILTSKSLISAGTERMLVSFGKSSLIDKARQQPEKVKMVLDKVKTDGIMTTYSAVKSKLNQPIPLGYCNVGVVSEVGAAVSAFVKGDRVVSNGSHSDVVSVPKNLCAKVPDSVTDEEASFTVVASIGLQGIRLVQPTLGEKIVVIGAGLIGLLTVQMLIANGCSVLAIDFDENKLSLAKEFGAEICNPSKGEDPVAIANDFSKGFGVDGVIITASTKESEPVAQAAKMSRKRGRIVLVGVTGLELNRSDFYEKELSFQVSCSYGPGRYDSNYENEGNDYPIGYVRWTEQRNFEAVLDMLSKKQLNVEPLITHRFEFDDAVNAYDVLTTENYSLGVILNYSSPVESRISSSVPLGTFKDICITYKSKDPCVGFIGAGNYASRVLIPAFKKANVNLHEIVASGGTNAVIHGNKMGFKVASSDSSSVFESDIVNTVVIATRHNTHAKFVKRAIETGKDIFVEKPLALTISDVEGIESIYYEKRKNNEAPRLMVGFNRRFSPHIQKMKSLLDTVRCPKSFIMTMNAGSIPCDHWTQQDEIGGGRIIGEACHFIDLMRFLADSKISSVNAVCIENKSTGRVERDNAAITLKFEDGSFGTIFYLANGASNFPKERVEVFVAGKTIQLDNFRIMTGYGWKEFKKYKLFKQDKGQNACAQAFVDSIRNGLENPIPVEDIFEVAKITIKADSLLKGH
ncbi:putative zinc-binding dehydrogenase [Francisella sp. W12-1067]|nr:putative zinc-binding dehydrogenase [Francisella sp. W12-1067]